jgi:hypothetical protein
VASFVLIDCWMGWHCSSAAQQWGSIMPAFRLLWLWLVRESDCIPFKLGRAVRTGNAMHHSSDHVQPEYTSELMAGCHWHSAYPLCEQCASSNPVKK